MEHWLTERVRRVPRRQMMVRTASWRLETTTIALALPPRSNATCSRKCSTTISTFCEMLYGCSRTQPMIFFMAALRSTSLSSHSLPSWASRKANL